ncbi:MAG: squalene-associated FAD-dependent desaturase [Alphaproteobacteria bacterium]|jgi:squalene-associated FAD-dependent desaturase
MNMRTVHIVGAGVAGLAAATTLVLGDGNSDGVRVVVHEAAGQAGGRCRSYYDPVLAMSIDNGNHLALSGNRALQRYLARIGSADQLLPPPDAAYPFVDLASGERWVVRPNTGALPWWIFASSRRVPGTRAREYLELAKLLRAPGDALVGDLIACNGQLWRRFLHPMLLAALNTAPDRAAATLVATLLRETFACGGVACKPLIAAQGLAKAFIDPAIAKLRAAGVEIIFSQRLLNVAFDAGNVVSALEFTDGSQPLTPGDAVVLAVPPWTAAELIPGLTVPTKFNAIVNCHFQCAPPPGAPAFLGLIGGGAEWVFAFEGRLSVTVSNADHLVDQDRAALAKILWADVAKAYGLARDMPPWQIVKERRATFAATPDQLARRPGTQTQWHNLFLAGDWIDTGLPATLEGAARSGERAAELICAQAAL